MAKWLLDLIGLFYIFRQKINNKVNARHLSLTPSISQRKKFLVCVFVLLSAPGVGVTRRFVHVNMLKWKYFKKEKLAGLLKTPRWKCVCIVVNYSICISETVFDKCSKERNAIFHYRVKNENPYLSFSMPSAYSKLCCRGLLNGWVRLCHRKVGDNTLWQQWSESAANSSNSQL